MNKDKIKSMMMSRSNRMTLVFVVALFPFIAIGQVADSVRLTSHKMSIQQAVDYASKNNVRVKNALLDVKYQEQVNREITSRAYPSINGNLGTTYNPNVATQVIPNFISPSTYQVLIDEAVQNGSTGLPIEMPADFGFIAAQFGTKYSATVGLSLSQTLFDGQVFVGLQARGATIDFAKKNVEVTEELIKTNIYKIYYQLVVSKTQIALMDSIIKLQENLLRDTRIIYENGFNEKLDIDRVNVRLTNLRTARNQAVNAASNGYYVLKLLMGMPVQDQLELTDTLTEDQVKEGALETLDYAYDNRKEYQYAQIGKKLNEYNIRRWKLSQIPTVALSGQYAKNAQRDKWNFFGKGDWFTISSISLNINVPIFNGFYTKAKIEQARIDLRKTENEINHIQLIIDNEVATARNNYRTAILDLDAQKRNMELAETVYQQTKKKYEIGTGSQTDINEAQTQLQEAQKNYTASLYSAIVAKVDFLKATGKL